MSPTPETRAGPCSRFPRVSGDEPAYVLPVILAVWFSPRERG